MHHKPREDESSVAATKNDGVLKKEWRRRLAVEVLRGFRSSKHSVLILKVSGEGLSVNLKRVDDVFARGPMTSFGFDTLLEVRDSKILAEPLILYVVLTSGLGIIGSHYCSATALNNCCAALPRRAGGEGRAAGAGPAGRRAPLAALSLVCRRPETRSYLVKLLHPTC